MWPKAALCLNPRTGHARSTLASGCPRDASMNASPRQGPTALGILCWILGILTVATPVAGWLLGAGAGRYGGYLIAAGVVLGALLNVPSLIANLFYARRRRWAVIWLNLVLLLQFVAVATALWFVGSALTRSSRESDVYRRTSQVYPAIKTNDPAAVEKALNVCAADCTGLLDTFLLNATVEGASRSMAYLLSKGANPTPGPVSSAIASLQTCEGMRLSALNSLAVSVARGDEAAIGLLLGKSDDKGRQKAAWVAAQRDRLDLLQRLLETGVPLTMRGTGLDENATLLNAAASGAALRVGAWLLKEKGFDANGDPQEPGRPPVDTPLLSLIGFAWDAREAPRLRAFLDMLVAHGAQLDRTSSMSGQTPLQKATWARSPVAADALIAAGASQASLTAEDRDRLARLRQNPQTGFDPNIDSRDCLP
ncbi:hypothetical protein [Vineibacter terrae]|uniref:hypothetical protein n=1 Tax=Vineibacter terrae TaxID=2586908 RepID=UPI002E327DDC|nr:hypothetical protein [Vineibacter terrae]